MTLIAMTIPDDPQELAGWLERRLVGLDLNQLVEELSAVHGRPSESTSLGDLLGGSRTALLQRGLVALPQGALRTLLTQPSLLLELQELILAEGGAHWDRLAAELPALDAAASRGAQRLALLAKEPTHRELVAEPARPRVPSYRQPWVVSLATAAAVLLAVYVFNRVNRPTEGEIGPRPHEVVKAPEEKVPPASGWGWAKRGALPSDVTPSDYLAKLADAAEEWFKQRPEDPVTLSKRIGEFRQGCSVLLLAEHKPLPEPEHIWLVNRCKTWAAKLDKHLADLEAGRDAAKVRGEMDETVHQIAAALQSRADHLRG
jgi:hypothetical protein